LLGAVIVINSIPALLPCDLLPMSGMEFEWDPSVPLKRTDESEIVSECGHGSIRYLRLEDLESSVTGLDPRFLSVCLQAASATERGPYCWLKDLDVVEESRRMGIGSQLLERLVELTRAQGLKGVLTQVGWNRLEEKEMNMRFYRKNGFVVIEPSLRQDLLGRLKECGASVGKHLQVIAVRLNSDNG
jgi:GNAT superfamily N-acetyltransferase